MIDRRSLARGVVAAGVLARAGAGRVQAATRGDTLGAQLLFPLDDREQTWTRMRRAKEAGYASVEFAAFNGLKPDELRRRADALGLTMPSMHVGADQVRAFRVDSEPENPALGGQPEATDLVFTPEGFRRITKVNAPKVRDLGARLMVFSGTRLANFATANSIARLCDAYNWSSTYANGMGLTLAIHPHDAEFRPMGDGTVFDFMARRLDPSVKFQLDIGWVVAAGVDLYALIDRYRDRIVSYHLKDVDRARRFPDWGAGGGLVDWGRFHSTAARAGRAYYVVEGGDLAQAVRFLGAYGWAAA
jgi:sugar phosphate isomerase/epimerase